MLRIITYLPEMNMELISEIKQVSAEKRIKDLLDREKNFLYEIYAHSWNTAVYTAAIASEYGYQGKYLDDVIRGALLHDIGKLYVPGKILMKKERLTESEWNEIKKHPEYGLRIAENENFNVTIKNMVLHHHEKNNGCGYPDGDYTIPDSVQILTVADMYDALISFRCYKKAFDKEGAINILKNAVKRKEISEEYVNTLASLTRKEEMPSCMYT